MEALTSRLRETENALLKVLSVVDDLAVQAAFQESPSSQSVSFKRPQNRTRKAGDPKAQADSDDTKNTLAIAQWDSLPLRTAADLRNWAQEAIHTGDEPPPETSPVFPDPQLLDPQTALTWNNENAHGRPEKDTTPCRSDYSSCDNMSQISSHTHSHHEHPSFPLPAHTEAQSEARQPTELMQMPLDSLEGEVLDIPQQFRNTFMW